MLLIYFLYSSVDVVISRAGFNCLNVQISEYGSCVINQTISSSNAAIKNSSFSLSPNYCNQKWILNYNNGFNSLKCSLFLSNGSVTIEESTGIHYRTINITTPDIVKIDANLSVDDLRIN